MDPCPIVVNELMPLRRVYKLFNTIGLRHLAVVDCREQVVGIVTRKDVLPEIIGERMQRRDERREQELEQELEQEQDATQREQEEEQLEQQLEQQQQQQQQQQEQRRQQAVEALGGLASPEGRRSSGTSASGSPDIRESTPGASRAQRYNIGDLALPHSISSCKTSSVIMTSQFFDMAALEASDKRATSSASSA